MDRQRFLAACTAPPPEGKSIGVLAERTLHAVLKCYFEPDTSLHEIKVGQYFADIFNQNGIFEIQTRSVYRLKHKLESFCEKFDGNIPITIVFPVPCLKWLCWIDEETGNISKPRKSPKRRRPSYALYELYGIKEFLMRPEIRICIVLLEVEEYRHLNGWSYDKKRGATRHDCVPLDIIDEFYLSSSTDYSIFFSPSLPISFTSNDYARTEGLSTGSARRAISLLIYLGIIERDGKKGRAFTYRKKTIL